MLFYAEISCGKAVFLLYFGHEKNSNRQNINRQILQCGSIPSQHLQKQIIRDYLHHDDFFRYELFNLYLQKRSKPFAQKSKKRISEIVLAFSSKKPILKT